MSRKHHVGRRAARPPPARRGPSCAMATSCPSSPAGAAALARRRRCRRRPARAAGARAASVARGASRGGGARRRRRQRQAHHEFAAPARTVAERAHRPAMHLDQRAHHREADPQPTLRAIQRPRLLHEQVERARQQLRGHARAVVAHLHHGLAAFDRHRQRDVPVRVGVLGGVVEQVREHLHQARGVGVHRQQVLRQRQRQLLSLLRDQRPADLHRLQQQRRPARWAASAAGSCPGSRATRRAGRRAAASCAAPAGR